MDYSKDLVKGNGVNKTAKNVRNLLVTNVPQMGTLGLNDVL